MGVSLFPRQARFVADLRQYPAYIGGIGSGKSFAGAVKVISRIGAPELGLVCAPTYPMLRDSTQRAIVELCDELGITYRMNRTEGVLRFDTGHEVLFRSLDNPDRLRGPNVHYAWIDEAAMVSRESWLIVKGRCRIGDAPQAWITSTPKGRNWIWEEWEREAKGDESDPTHPLYRVATTENPELPKGFAESLGYSGTFAAQELRGEFVSFEGLVYSQFRRSVHVRAVDTDGWRVVLGVDVGSNNPTVVLALAIAGDGRMHVMAEFYRRNMSASDIVEAIAAEYARHNPDVVYIDPSAAGYIADLGRAGLRVRKADNDVMVGIGRVAAALDSGLTVDPSCANLIAEFEAYRYPDGKRADDRPVKESDHAMDALRYAVMGVASPRPRVQLL